MDKVVEEALTNMINRIDALEAKVERLEGRKGNMPTSSKNPSDRPVWKISDAQAKLIKNLGGVPDMEMSKQDAGKLIDDLILKKNQQKQPKKVHEEIAENDPYSEGYEGPFDPEPTPLSQEEIEEIGEENLL